MSTSSHNSNDSQDELPTQPSLSSRPKCSIRVDGRVDVTNRLRYNPESGEIEEGEWSRPIWDGLEETGYYCSECDESFDTRKQAEKHLKQSARYRIPVPKQLTESRQESFEGDRVKIGVAQVEAQTTSSGPNTIAKVKDGLGALLATSRRSYDLPSDYQFEDWEPLNSGKLTFPKGTPRIGPDVLKRAVDIVVPSPVEHDPSDFTLYDRGDAPFLLIGYGQAVVIAPKKSRNPTV